MINVIHAGSNGFDALLYPEQNQNNLMYIQNQFQRFGNAVSDAGRQFVDGAKALFEKIHSAEAMALERLAKRSAKSLFAANVITPLLDRESLQAAQPIMQRWNMAHPEIRALYHQQRCDGYADSYVDLFPGLVAADHYDYRRVMDGVIQETDDSWSVSFYPDDLVEGDRELDHHEKCMIMKTWDVMSLLIQEKIDPTNPFGGKL